MIDDDAQDRQAEPTPAPAPPTPRRGRRLLGRLAMAAVLLLGLVVVAAPGLLSSWARTRAEAALGERIRGGASIEELRIALNGKVLLRGLELVDEAGDLVALVPEARFDLGIRSLMMGKRDIALHVKDVHVELVQDEEGRWNVQDLVRADDGEAEGGTEEAGEPWPETPPDLEGRLELLGATVTVRSPRSVLELRDVDLRIGLDGDSREFSVEGGAVLAGGDGDAGTLVIDGALWPDAKAGFRLDELALRGLELGAVQEALRLVGQPLEEGSRLVGEVDLTAHGSFTGFEPDGRFGMEAEVVGRDLDVALVSGGERALAFDDPEARASVAVQRVRKGEEPNAILDLNARGGDVTVQGGWDGAATPAISAAVSLRGVDASAGLDRLIARVHPVFASASAVEGAAVEGLVTAEVAVAYDGALTMEDLVGGAADLETELFGGVGSLSVSEGAITSSPLFAQLLEALGRPASPTFELAPLGFQVADGRIAYTQPWTWTIQGAETRFEGGVGLDGALELQWVVPVTDGLARQNSLFASLEGETFVVPLGGTLTAPSFDLVGALGQLAVRAADREAQKLGDEARSKLQDAIGDEAAGALEGILGGDGAGAIQEAARGALGGTADAATLLREADALWNRGSKDEAAKLYRRVRKEFPLSPAYLLNKKRVKARSKG